MADGTHFPVKVAPAVQRRPWPFMVQPPPPAPPASPVCNLGPQYRTLCTQCMPLGKCQAVYEERT